MVVKNRTTFVVDQSPTFVGASMRKLLCFGVLYYKCGRRCFVICFFVFVFFLCVFDVFNFVHFQLFTKNKGKMTVQCLSATDAMRTYEYLTQIKIKVAFANTVKKGCVIC